MRRAGFAQIYALLAIHARRPRPSKAAPLHVSSSTESLSFFPLRELGFRNDSAPLMLAADYLPPRCPRASVYLKLSSERLINLQQSCKHKSTRAWALAKPSALTTPLKSIVLVRGERTNGRLCHPRQAKANAGK